MAIANIWTIKGAADDYTTFAARNLQSVSAAFRTQSADTVSFRQVSAYDADPEFAYGDQVTIQRDGVQYFAGICTAVQRRGTGTAESLQYAISGPWWQLEQIIYRQNYTRYVDGVEASPLLAKLILATDDDGERLNSSEIITLVVNYAISELGASALFTLGDVDGATEMPYEELNALSCAEVIKRVLRWNPDIVAYFDYSAATPVLHFKKRANLPSATFAHADVVISEASINPRNDLQKAGVVVQYERTDTVGSNDQTVIITDSAGVTTDPTSTLYLFFDLEGSSTSILSQKVTSATIQKTSATWWAARHPKLLGASSISIADATQTAVDDGGDGANDGTSYTKELMSGSVADWMSGVGVCDQVIKASVTYTPAGGSSKTDVLRMVVKGTNADSKTYNTVGDVDPAEPTPTGLAASILSSLSALQYEGSITLTQQDVSAVNLAKAINIAGGRSEWESMDAQVYSVTHSLDTGVTQIAFGPAKHLGATDLFQLLRTVRTRVSASGTIRTGGNSGRDTLPAYSPNSYTADDSGDTASAPVGINVIKASETTVTVTAGSVTTANHSETTHTVTNGDEIWITATLPSEGEAPTSVISEVNSPGTDTATRTSRRWATITISGGILTVTPIRSGSPDIDSCGTSHIWVF